MKDRFSPELGIEARLPGPNHNTLFTKPVSRLFAPPLYNYGTIRQLDRFMKYYVGFAYTRSHDVLWAVEPMVFGKCTST